jgi:hypothetical protein
MPESRALAFSHLSADCFPMRVELIDAATREERWSAVIMSADDMPLRIPTRHAVNAHRPTDIRVRLGDGTVHETLLGQWTPPDLSHGYGL